MKDICTVTLLIILLNTVINVTDGEKYDGDENREKLSDLDLTSLRDEFSSKRGDRDGGVLQEMLITNSNERKDHLARRKKNLGKLFDGLEQKSEANGRSFQGKKMLRRYGSSAIDHHGVDFVEESTRHFRPKASTNKKYFNLVHNKHFKVKPRQQIEVVEDNDDTGLETRQGEYESHFYDEDNDNEDMENSYQNGLSNSYITVIDHYDNREPDSYNTLSSDAAKNEYTNVENSISEGASQESQLLGKEVSDVLGALSKSDSRIGQIVGGTVPHLHVVGGAPYKPNSASFTTKANDAEEPDRNGNSQNGPTAETSDVTIIEDNDESNNNREGSPAKPGWENQSVQEETTSNLTHTNYILDNKTESWEPFLPIPQNTQVGKDDKDPEYPVSDIDKLKNTLDMFENSKPESTRVNASTQFQITQPHDDKEQIVLTGEAEEGSSPNNATFDTENISHENRFPLYSEEERQSNDKDKNISANGDWSTTAVGIPLQLQREDNRNDNGDNDQDATLSKMGNSEFSELSTKPYFDSSSTNIRTSNNESAVTHSNDEKEQESKFASSMSHSPTSAEPPSNVLSTSNSHALSVNEHREQETMNLDKPIHFPVSNTIIHTISATQGFDKVNKQHNNDHGFSYVGVPLAKESHDRVLENVGTVHSEPQMLNLVVTKEDGWNSSPDNGIVFSSGKPVAVASDSSSNATLDHLDPMGSNVSVNNMTKLERGNQEKSASNTLPLYQVDLSGRGSQSHDSKMLLQPKKLPFPSGKSEYHSQENHYFPRKSNYEGQSNENSRLTKWPLGYQQLAMKSKDMHRQTDEHPSSTMSQNKSRTMGNALRMLRLSRFHSSGFNPYAGFKISANSSGGREMFFKDLKLDEKGKNLNPEEQPLTSDYLRVLPGISNNYTSKRTEDGSVEVLKGTPVLHQTVYDISSLAFASEGRIQREGNSFARDPETESQQQTAAEETNAHAPFVHQRLPLPAEESPPFQRDTSKSTTSVDADGQSLHQVLVNYFRNETDLREKLEKQMNSSGPLNASNISAVSAEFAKAGKIIQTLQSGIQMQNNSTQLSQESSQNDDMENTGNQPSQQQQVTNSDPAKTENSSLAKYLEEFISMVDPNNKLAYWNSNDSQLLSEEHQQESHENAQLPGLVPEKISEALKKENVSDLKNKIIIEVSPNSLKELIKSRSHNDLVNSVDKGKLTLNVSDVGKITSISSKEQLKNPETGTGSLQTNAGSSTNTTYNENNNLDLLYRKELKSLEISLSRDFMTNWIYYQRSMNDIGITPNMLRSGIANLGSPDRLRRVFQKTLAGSDLNVLVVGGSISAGGGLEKDRGNVEGVYHKAFSDWWNNTVTPITTAELKINNVAIGGTDSEYFAYCIKNYMRELPDIVIWELAANDYKRYTGRSFVPAKPLEQLTRIILKLPSHPALIFANFFRGDYYKTTAGQDCPDSEDEGGKTIAQYYKLTSLSWRNVICSPESENTLPLKKLFSSDGYHPSLLGHAQMSTLLISYLKGVFEETISQEMNSIKTRHRQSLEEKKLTPLPEPIYNDPVTPRPLCWTLLTPDYSTKLRNTLPDLEFTEANGFQFSNVSHWPIRRDRLRCLRAIQPEAVLKMKFLVPSFEGSGDTRSLNARSGSELAITTHNSYGGLGEVWLDDNLDAARMIVENPGQKRTQIDIITRSLKPGQHTLTVLARKPGFCLSAVAVL